MPELPEVETTLRGIKKHIVGQKIINVIFRHTRLRWDLPPNLPKILPGEYLRKITRRSKYLIFEFDQGAFILHLGMSGSLRILKPETPAGKHDHVDIIFANQTCLRFTDPRRFGALVWTTEKISDHRLIKHLGPEPFSSAFNGNYLLETARQRKIAIKSFIMDGKVVAGVGNIYATEALFIAGILPQRAAGTISLKRYIALASAIKIVLKKAIQCGGTTLKDFTRSDGSPGYFRIELKVYGKENQSCPRCKAKLKSVRIAGRNSVYCPKCQT